MTWRRRFLPRLLIAIAALLAVLPLVVHGCSCGHDFNFHLNSWMDAAAQMRHGTFRPVWDFSAAWNAGEPRFLLYPPLSWTIGAVLTLVLPFAAVPVVFTWLCFLLSGLAMHTLLRERMGGVFATAGACVYLANPYMLFVAYERTAFAELLAAAWIPLLLAAILRERPTIARTALPVFLLWITNAPAAILGSYTILFIGGVRLALELRNSTIARPLRTYALPITAGYVTGVLMSAFYLLPTAVERGFIQVGMLLLPALQPESSFLFGRTGEAFHDAVLQHASWIATGTLASAFVAGAVLLLRPKTHRRLPNMGSLQVARHHGEQRTWTIPLTLYSVAVLLLLLPVSDAIWRHAPELRFLQFPWRFLAAESAVAVLLLGLAFGEAIRKRWAIASVCTLLCVAACTLTADRIFRQACDEEDPPAIQRQTFLSGRGAMPTDEYTPNDADNDALDQHLPPAWLGNGANAKPSGSAPNITADGLQIAGPAVEISGLATEKVYLQAPPHTLPFLIVRMRAFPGWHVLRDGMELHDLPTRDDGLVAVPLPASATPHAVAIVYHFRSDQRVGFALSIAVWLIFFGAETARRVRARGGLVGTRAG